MGEFEVSEGPQTYDIVFQKRARKQLAALPRKARQQIERKAASLAANPRQAGVIRDPNPDTQQSGWENTRTRWNALILE